MQIYAIAFTNICNCIYLLRYFALINFMYFMNSINERIQFIINERFSGNVSAFCRNVDVKQPTMNTILGERKSKPSFDIISNILNARALNDIDANWLITGKGSITKSNDLVDGSFAVKTFFVSKYEIDNYIQNCNNADYITKLPKISIIPTTRQFGHTAFEVVDDSMVATSADCLKPGDIIVCSAFEKDSLFNVSSGCITCLIFHKDLGYMIRKAKDFNKETRSFLAVPLNPLYDNAIMFLNDIDKILYVHQAIIRY